MLPSPSSSFTIPSIHDDTILECRVYHPKSGTHDASLPETKAVTIAHPYTPLGGCFEDHVLHAAGLEFLNRGYVLGLFNLRGAGASKGSPSWTSKPEQDDYQSFVGFLALYMDEMYRSSQQAPELDSSSLPKDGLVDEISHQPGVHLQSQSSRTQPVLVLGGYSYGSQLVRHIPDIGSILAPFSSPTIGSAAAEIRLRAEHLARERVLKVKAAQAERTEQAGQPASKAAQPRGRTLMVDCALGSPVYGGEESSPGTRRVSRESRRSVRSVTSTHSTKSVKDRVRKTLSRTRGLISKDPSDQRPNHDSPTADQAADKHTTDESSRHSIQVLSPRAINIPTIRYLLISPLLPPLSSLLALSSSRWIWSKSKTDSASDKRLVVHDSLVLWGSEDVMTSGRRLGKWADELNVKAGSASTADTEHGQDQLEKPRSRLRALQIDGAGHFWLEEGKEAELRSRIRDWLVEMDE